MHSKRLPGWARRLHGGCGAGISAGVRVGRLQSAGHADFPAHQLLERRGHLQQAAGRRCAVRRTAGILRLQRVPRRGGAPTRPGARRCSSSTRCPGCCCAGRMRSSGGNLLFIAAGWTFFALAARLSWKRQVVFALALAAMNAPIRYVFSAMQEPLALCAGAGRVGVRASWPGGPEPAPPGAYSAPCVLWRPLCALMRPCSGSTRWRWPGATAAAPLFALRAGLCRWAARWC